MSKADKILICVFLLVFLAVSGFIINSGTDGSEIYTTKAGGNVQSAVVNINTSSEYQLSCISGIGDYTAGQIVQYRNTNGPFKTTEEIKKLRV